MAHYLIAHLNGGRYGEAQILSGAGINELHRGVADYQTMGISAGKYGMGWFVGRRLYQLGHLERTTLPK